MPPLTPLRAVVRSAGLVSVLVGLAGAVACSIIVGNSLPSSYRCNLNASPIDTCGADQVCAPVESQSGQVTEGICVPRCSRAPCAPGLACGSSDWCVSVNGATPDATVDDATSVDGSAGDALDENDVPDKTPMDAQAPMDARVDAYPDAPGNAEAGHGDAGACASGGVGCPCGPPGTATGCELLAFCTDRQVVSGTYLGDGGTVAAGGVADASAGVCTKACCTSTDCDKGSVCFATGAGGNYCVPGAVVGDRSTTGPLNALGGTLCDAGTSCRSGLCALEGFCAETCCTTAPPGPPRMMQGNPPAQCTGMGGACRLGNFQGAQSAPNDMPYVPRCAPAMGTARNGVLCTGNSSCQSNLCVVDAMGDFMCSDPCRKPEDCGGMQTCEYVHLSGNGAPANGNLVAACVPLAPTGPGPADAASDWGPCKTAIDCARGYCASSGDGGPGVCVSVCFGDGDCVSSGTCRPQTLQVGSITYSVLACK
jgi:hypothetical protein